MRPVALALVLSVAGPASAQDQPAPDPVDTESPPAAEEVPPPPGDDVAVPEGYQIAPPPPPPPGAPPGPGYPAEAPPPEPPASRHEHTGFFLRFVLGVGGVSTSEDDGISDLVRGGGAGFFDIGIGGAITENLILHADILLGSIPNPSLSVDGVDVGDLDAPIGFSSLGAALTYYFMPINIYVTGALGVGQVRLDDGTPVSDPDTTDAGFAANVGAGKEWWVGSEWGLGVALRLLFMRLPHAPGGDLTVFGGSVGFVITYN
jgi:hypothetical protein